MSFSIRDILFSTSVFTFIKSSTPLEPSVTPLLIYAIGSLAINFKR